MAIKRERKGAKSLLESIADWSYRHGLSEDPYVVGLYTAIKRKRNLSAWASMNAFDLLPFPTNSFGQNALKISKQLAIIRNILVYVPVALTWAAVSQATSAFARFVEKNNAATVNFLEFWQNGYNVLSKHWTIGYVARLDYLIIVGVITLTILSTYLNEKGFTTKSEMQNQIEAERTELAIEITTYLHQHRTPSNLTISEDLQEGISNILGGADDLREAIDLLNKNQNGIGK